MNTSDLTVLNRAGLRLVEEGIGHIRTLQRLNDYKWRSRQVFLLKTFGFLTKEIVNKLDMGKRTIEGIRTSMRRRLGHSFNWERGVAVVQLLLGREFSYQDEGSWNMDTTPYEGELSPELISELDARLERAFSETLPIFSSIAAGFKTQSSEIDWTHGQVFILRAKDYANKQVASMLDLGLRTAELRASECRQLSNCDSLFTWAKAIAVAELQTGKAIDYRDIDTWPTS